jgi:hypothetical protein
MNSGGWRASLPHPAECTSKNIEVAWLGSLGALERRTEASPSLSSTYFRCA